MTEKSGYPSSENYSLTDCFYFVFVFLFFSNVLLPVISVSQDGVTNGKR